MVGHVDQRLVLEISRRQPRKRSHEQTVLFGLDTIT